MNLINKIPVTIITGFLGAGKTTLLNRLISEYPAKKFAIIENEFGEISLDTDIIINIDNSNICELANGCICCTLNEDLADLLKDLLRSGKQFNHLLIETTGIADPSTVIQVFFSDEEIKSRYNIDSVICITDALHFLNSINEGAETRRQVAISDVILLNKVDIAEESKVSDTRKILTKINPQAMIIETHQTQTQDIDLLDLGFYRTSKIASYTLDVTSQQGGEQDFHNISSHSFIFPGDFNIEKFSFWIEYFLSLNQANILRIKGILSFIDNPQKMILQSVRSSYLLDDGDFWGVNEKRNNRMVIIGKDLNYDDILEALVSLTGD